MNDCNVSSKTSVQAATISTPVTPHQDLKTSRAKLSVKSSGRLEMAIAGDTLSSIGGSPASEFNITLLQETVAAVYVPSDEQDGHIRRARMVVAALEAFQPKDEVEGMLAAQAVALHVASMECLRRSIINDQPAETASRLRKDAANLARAMTDMLETLSKRRGKNPQVVRVERVVVQDNAQAIIGNLQAGAAGGGLANEVGGKTP